MNGIRNAMTVDVEEFFQVSAFEGHISFADWERLPSGVEANVERILRLFADHDTRATFFVLGWIAQRHPDLVRQIASAGHEVASHGLRHVRVTQQSPREFREDITATKGILEDCSGGPVQGYRAASFSIVPSTLWALDVLADVGYEYSSSIFPIRHDLYGMPDAPRFPFYHRPQGIIEIPVTTVSLFNQNLPAGGGGYFRLFPYAYYRWALRRVNTRDGRPGVFYFHPWEIDPGQPRQDGVSWKTRIRHYTNLSKMESRLGRVLNDFRWGRMDEVFLGRSYPSWTESSEPTAQLLGTGTGE